MRLSRTIPFLVLLLAGYAGAQSWSESYERGLAAIKLQRWAEARSAFRQAASLRPDDFSGPTTLPGSVTEPKRWRSGLPYSPNFGAAYASYRAALAAKSDETRSQDLRDCVAELELLLKKGQNSREAFYILSNAYSNLRDVAGQQKLDQKLKSVASKLTWKVDPELFTPEEAATIASLDVSPQTRSKNTIVMVEQPKPAQQSKTVEPQDPNKGPKNPTSNDVAPPKTTSKPNVQAPELPDPVEPAGGALGKVAPVPTKFALIVGNSETKLPNMGVDFSASDALAVREKLVEFAGYPVENVDMVVNGTAEQIMAAATALSQRVDETSTVLIFFSGVGVNVDGKDYLAGVDTDSLANTASMASKSGIYELLMSRGAKIFSFFQANRPIVSGRYFGMETPMVGAISQMQATMPGGNVSSLMKSGKPIGLFTDAFGSVLTEFRSNRIPIQEFGWQVFGAMRGGNTKHGGVGSYQVPTLPVITNMASDARF